MIDLAIIEVLISAAIIFLILAVVYPRAFLFILILFQWAQYIPRIGKTIETLKYSLGGINVTVNDVVFASVVIVTIIGAIRHPPRFMAVLAQPLGKFILLFMAYQLAQMASSVVSGVPLDGVIRESSNYLVCIYSFYIVLYYDRESFHRTLNFGHGLLLCLPIFQIYMLYTGESWLTSSGSERTYHISPNIFFLLGIIYHSIQPIVNLKNITAIVYLLAGLVMTQYRSAFLALLVVFAGAARYMLGDGRMDRLIIGIMAILLTTAVGFVGISIIKPDYFTRTMIRYSDTINPEDQNVVVRLYMWSVAWEAFKHNPLFGVGFGHSIYAYTDTRSHINEKDWSPHNFIMNLLAKEGLVGLLLVLIILLVSYSYLKNDVGILVYGEHIRRQLILFFLSLIVIHLMNATFTSTKANFVLWIFSGYLILGALEYKQSQLERVPLSSEQR